MQRLLLIALNTSSHIDMTGDLINFEGLVFADDHLPHIDNGSGLDIFESCECAALLGNSDIKSIIWHR